MSIEHISEGNDPSVSAHDTRCGGPSAEQALEESIGKIPPDPYGDRFLSEGAETEGYNPCEALSWIIVHHPGASASLQRHIMLFHFGHYLGTATAKAYGFMPTVTRVSSERINVTYYFQRPGEATAEHSGETHASFYWSEEQQRVMMEGQTPDQAMAP